jgi:hypothetical protein
MHRPSLRNRQKLAVKTRMLVFSASMIVAAASAVYIINTGSSTSTMAADIDLLSFRGKQNGDNILLTWVTATEKNNDYFILEKSADGQTFNELAKVDGSGNSNQSRTYHFLDRKPVKGANYYRITQNGVTDEKQYRTIQVQHKNLTPFIELKNNYPNPFKESMSLTFYSATDGTVRFVLMNSSGQEVRSMAFQCDAGITTATWKNLSALPPGTYSIVMIQGNERVTGRTAVKK